MEVTMPTWTGDTSEGLVFIRIDGGNYTYAIDAALIPKTRRRFAFSAWKTIRELERICRWYADAKGVLHERT